jgi:hypothetical protein
MVRSRSEETERLTNSFHKPGSVSLPGFYVQEKVREGETGNPSRSRPGLRGTRREAGLGHERYTAGAGRAGAVPFSIARLLNAGSAGGTRREASLGCREPVERVAWAKRKSGVYQTGTAYKNFGF